eukprot:GHVU01104554.1.p1 GENE.GHVU01104554.1~~GHVU01104554.1.p1  ORF type:complete len:173 (+),score=25.09 GHVU01104554.1:401-919(+)
MTRKQVEEQQATLERRSHQLEHDRQKVVQEVAAKEAEILARETSTAAEKARVARELQEGRHQATLAEHRLAEEQLKLNNEKESLAVSKANLLERQKDLEIRARQAPDPPTSYRLDSDSAAWQPYNSPNPTQPEASGSHTLSSPQAIGPRASTCTVASSSSKRVQLIENGCGR